MTSTEIPTTVPDDICAVCGGHAAEGSAYCGPECDDADRYADALAAGDIPQLPSRCNPDN